MIHDTYSMNGINGSIMIDDGYKSWILVNHLWLSGFHDGESWIIMVTVWLFNVAMENHHFG